MKKFLRVIFCVLVIVCVWQMPVLCADEPENPPQNNEEELMFAPIELDLSEEREQEVKKFKIRVEQDSKPKLVKNYRKNWYDSKFYRYQYYSDPKNLQPLIAPASYGAYLESELDDNTTIQVGQYNLSWYDGAPISFIGKAESDFDMGATMSGHGRKFDYAIGAYTATDTLNNSYGGIVSTKPQKIWNSKGDFSFGTGLYSNDYGSYTKNTAGFFTKYRRGKFTVSGQLAQNTYSNSTNNPQSFHLTHQYQINDHLMIRGKLVKEINSDYSQDELSLRFSPSFEKDSIFVEISSSQINNLNNVPQQRFKIMTNINF